MHPNTTEKRTATDIVSQQHKASETGEANRVLINKNRCPQQDSSSTPAASRARRSLGPAPSPAAAQYGAYPATPSYPATPGLLSDTSDIQRYQRYSAIPGPPGYARAIRSYPYRRYRRYRRYRLPVPATGHPYRRSCACCANAQRGAARLYHSRRRAVPTEPTP